MKTVLLLSALGFVVRHLCTRPEAASHVELAFTAILACLCLGCFHAMLHVYRYLPAAAGAVLVYRFMHLSHGTVQQSLLAELVSFVNAQVNQLQVSPNPVLAALLPTPARAGFALGDIFGALALWSFYRWASFASTNLHEISSVSAIVRLIKNFGYGLVKNMSFVTRELAKEQTKLEQELEDDIKTKARAIGSVTTRLPLQGMPPKKILELMEAETKKENVVWQDGRVSGAVYHGISEHQDLLNKAFGLYSISNPLHPDIWPSGMKFESEVIKMVATLMDGSAGSTSSDEENGYYQHNPNVCGCTTSGGTESIILAIKAHRDYYRDVRGITEPEMIACTSAHAAVDKACDMLGIKLVHVPMDESPSYTYESMAWDGVTKQGGYRMSVKHTLEAINMNTIMIYSSAPSYPQGVIDDIPTLSRIAQRYAIGLHVDCCLGGFVLPFAKMLQRERIQPAALAASKAGRGESAQKASSSRARSRSRGAKGAAATTSNGSADAVVDSDEPYFYGQNIPDFDFGLPGVTSMSVDTHKFGYALKGTSVVLYSNKQLRQAQYFCYSEWTGGMYTTPTIAGSRSGGLIAQCWASMMALGEEGYKAHTRDILDTAREVARGVRAIPGLRLLGESAAMIVCFASEEETLMNTYTVSDSMTKKGWSLNTLQNPACVHLCCTVRHVGRVQEFLADLTAAAFDAQEQVRRGVKAAGKAAIYGMASGMPSGPVNELLKVYNDVVLKI